MITATMFEKVVEVKIRGGGAEFGADLLRFKNDIDQEDREYAEYRRVWIVKNIEKYIRVPYIRRAILDRDKQLSLF